ncbi:MAG TPA: YkgJ family cysteine cluster protein [Bryobacterales bacterium]|nr:YkgJ family cysteine cluster protein [Bryobacterales bacterium]
MTEPVKVGLFNFRFECQRGCINCCTRSGHVFVTEEDIGRIAAHLGLERGAFEKRYVYRSKLGARLTVPSAHGCHFLVEGGCSIHEVKPLQCRVFPYWPENVATRSAWKGLRRYCPGVGVGPLVQIETVRAQAQSYCDAFPEL